MKLFSNFSGCIKCGANDAFTRYDRNSEKMIRKCKNCGYEWQENPLDLVNKIEEGGAEENDLLVE